MQGLTFNEATHQYVYNGQPAISVTTLLKKTLFKDKYKDIDEAVLKAAAEKGTRLHESIEMLEKYGIESNNPPAELRDYKFLKRSFKFEVIESELPVILHYKDLLIAGTIDQVQMLNGALGLADIKRTATLDKNYLAYQLNIYRMAYKESYGKEPEFLKAIHLRDGVRKYLNIPVNEELIIKLLEDYIGGKYD